MRIALYHQCRVDGGIRTGILLNDQRVFERFVEGDPAHQDDPLADGIRWYVDVYQGT